MIFRQLFDSVSGTYSYLLASRAGGEALILDPVLEKVDRYCQLLRELDLKLVKAVDTHLHADHVTGFPGKEWLQHRADRAMVAVERRRVETTVGFDRPAVLAEFHDIFSHDVLSFQIAVIDLLEHCNMCNARLSATTIIS